MLSFCFYFDAHVEIHMGMHTTGTCWTTQTRIKAQTEGRCRRRHLCPFTHTCSCNTAASFMSQSLFSKQSKVWTFSFFILFTFRLWKRNIWTMRRETQRFKAVIEAWRYLRLVDETELAHVAFGQVLWKHQKSAVNTRLASWGRTRRYRCGRAKCAAVQQKSTTSRPTEGGSISPGAGFRCPNLLSFLQIWVQGSGGALTQKPKASQMQQRLHADVGGSFVIGVRKPKP